MNLQDAMVSDRLWELVKPLIPPPREEKKKPGRTRVPDRPCLAGIVYILRTGCQWKYLPCKELQCGSPATVWRRLEEWTEAGLWQRLHGTVVEWDALLGAIDPKHVVIDSASFRAIFGGRTQDPTARIGQKTAVKG